MSRWSQLVGTAVAADRRPARPLLLRQRRRIGDRDRAENELPLLAQFGGRPEKTQFVSLAGSYHGETLGALSVTDVALFRDTYAPLLRDERAGAEPGLAAGRAG